MSQQLNDDVRDYFAQHQNLLAVADSETRALMWTYYQQLQKKPTGNDEKLEDYIINRLCTKSHCPGFPLCNLCVSVVCFCSEFINHRDTENTEVAQRRVNGRTGVQFFKW